MACPGGIIWKPDRRVSVCLSCSRSGAQPRQQRVLCQVLTYRYGNVQENMVTLSRNVRLTGEPDI